MIYDILTDSIKYALSKPKISLILGILTLFDFILVPLIFTIGYYYKVMKESTRGMINGDEEMPALNNFKQLLIDGFKVFSAGVIYCIPPFIVYVILMQGFEMGYLPYYLVDPISDSIFFIFYCYFYIALPNMAYYDSFKKAFDFKQINEIIIKKIGVLPLIIVLLFVNFLEFAFGSLSVDIADVLNKLFVLNTFSAQTLLFILGTVVVSILITPFIEILLSRSTSLLYVNDEYD